MLSKPGKKQSVTVEQTPVNINFNKSNIDDFIYSNIKYGFTLTEGIGVRDDIKTFQDYKNMNGKDTITLKQLLQMILEDYIGVETEIWKIYFQMLTACYAMFLSGVNHNDLHPGNVWIQKLDKEEEYRYYINGKLYKLNITHKVMLYDFDRSSCEKFPNKINDVIRKDGGLNKIYNQKDMIKIFSYFYNIDNNNCSNKSFSDEDDRDLYEKTLNLIKYQIELTLGNDDKLKEVYSKCNGNISNNFVVESVIKNLDELNGFNKTEKVIDIIYNRYLVDDFISKNNGYRIYVCNENCFDKQNINSEKILRFLDGLKYESITPSLKKRKREE
jgi:hypothetical protein